MKETAEVEGDGGGVKVREEMAAAAKRRGRQSEVSGGEVRK